MPPKCRQSSLQRVERFCGDEFLWWTTKAGRVLRAEEEKISKESQPKTKKESLRIKETVNLTTKSKSLLFVIMHFHRIAPPHQKDVGLIRKTMIKY
jgi:hypothetical protein